MVRQTADLNGTGTPPMLFSSGRERLDSTPNTIRESVGVQPASRVGGPQTENLQEGNSC